MINCQVIFVRLKNKTVKELNDWIATKQIPSGGHQFVKIEKLNIENITSNIYTGDQKEELEVDQEALEIVAKMQRKEITAWEAVKLMKERTKK